MVKVTEPILALDVATVTGWMTSDGKSGVIRLHGETEEKLEQLAEFVQSKIRETGAKIVAYEEATYGAGARKGKGVQWNVFVFHSQMRGIVRMTAKMCGAEPKPVAIATAKSFATGNGRAKKDQVIRCFERERGYKPADDNEADAWAVLVAAQQGAFMQKKPRKRKPKPLPPGVIPRKRPNMLF